MPIERKTGGQISYIKNIEAMCLSEKQADYFYEKVEEGKVINVTTIKHELEQDLDREGQTKMTRDTKIKTEERFSITGQVFTLGRLLDGTGCQILLDTGATKSYMSKSI